jgi:hypothetical protein
LRSRPRRSRRRSPVSPAPAALAAYQKAEIDKWWPIVKAANMKVE